MGGPQENRLFLDVNPEDPVGRSTDTEMIQYCEDLLRQTEDYLDRTSSGL